jgi:iron complex transport system ATP-binding protein
MIQFENVQCGYGKKIILSDVSATIEKGKLTCLLGKNGAGKTTLFKSVLGILPTLGGQILYDGKALQTYNAKQFARYISYVPQAHGTPFPYSVFDVVLMGQYVYSDAFSGKPGNKNQFVAWSCIESLGIEHLAHKSFSKISGGEKQMVLIARAMAQQPRFIAMDEPTSSLDMGNQVRVMEQARMLTKKGFGVIMNTHSPQQALQYADVVMLLNKGKIEQCGNPDDILHTSAISELYGTPLEITETCTASGSKRKVLITL